MAIERLYPIGDKVLIKPDKAKNETAGGIILTTKGNKSSTGTVAAVGPGLVAIDGTVHPLQCKPLDRVMFAAVDATVSMRTITMNGTEYLLIPESQVFGVIEESAVEEVEEEIEGDDAKAKEIWV
jgi:chaperonin GroES